MLFRTSPPSPASARVQARHPRHVISEELFRDALVRERKRADRFEEAFALVLITIDRRRLSPQLVAQLADAMSHTQTGAGRSAGSSRIRCSA
jgi:hypothetical protein